MVTVFGWGGGGGGSVFGLGGAIDAGVEEIVKINVGMFQYQSNQ